MAVAYTSSEFKLDGWTAIALVTLSSLAFGCTAERSGTPRPALAADSSMAVADGAPAADSGMTVAAADSGMAAAAADSGMAPAAGGAQSVTAGTAAPGSAGSPAATVGDDSGVADSGSEPPRVPCLDGITNYEKTGPFSYDVKQFGMVRVWAPRVPTGCKVPIVHFSNGTGAQCSNYTSILEHIASHGFLTTCYENPDTGDGTPCIAAVETALSEYPDLADTKVGSAGHHVGGGGAILCVYRAEQKWGTSMIYAGDAAEPVSGSGAVSNYQELYGMIKSPIFMFNGSADMLVPISWVRDGYDALHSEKWWYEAEGATHIPVPERWARQSAVVWFRWKLLGDSIAGDYFKNMPNGADWNLQEMDPGM